MAEAASGDACEPCGGSQPVKRFEAVPLHAQPTGESNPAASSNARGGAPAVGHIESRAVMGVMATAMAKAAGRSAAAMATAAATAAAVVTAGGARALEASAGRASAAAARGGSVTEAAAMEMAAGAAAAVAV